MGPPLANLTFRYQGSVDFKRLYEECKDFFLNRTDVLKLAETKHKEKDDEIEVVWKIQQNFDLYNQIEYEVEFKLQDKKNVTIVQDGVERTVQEGKLRVYIKATYETNYEVQTPAGKFKMFEDEKSWLHKLYKTVTARDRSDMVEDLAAMTSEELLEMIKALCDVDARN